MMEKIKRLWLIFASSFTINWILLFVLVGLSLFSIGSVIVWRVIAIIYCLNCCFLNANYFDSIRRRVKRKYGGNE